MSELYPSREPMIDPPLDEFAAPLMGNPVLMRGTTGRRSRRGGSAMAWIAGAVAVVAALGAGGYYWANHAAQPPLMASTAAPPSAYQAPVTTPASPSVPAQAPAPIAAATPAPPTPVAATPVATTPVAAAPAHARNLVRNEHGATVSRRATARPAQSAGADVSATAPATPPPASQVTQAPAQAPEPAAAPVVAPPPATPAPNGP